MKMRSVTLCERLSKAPKESIQSAFLKKVKYKRVEKEKSHCIQFVERMNVFMD